LVARRQGIETAGIDLWMLGGMAKMSRDADSPGAEFRIAAAGPLVTIVIIGLCAAAGAALAGWPRFWDAVTLTQGADVTPGLLLLAWLGTINATLFAFNLLPAFPLDGGRIARAITWRVTRDRMRGTRIAATLGQFFAYGLIGLGVAELLVFRGTFSGIWLILIGWFISQGARGELVRTAFSERIGTVTVADIMDAEPVAVPADLDLQRAQDEFFLRYRWPWFPVVDGGGRFVGLVRREQVQGLHAEPRAVRDVMDGDGGDWRVGQDTPLESLLASEPLRRTGALMAVDREGVLRGVVTLDQVRRALQRAAVPSPPAA
ncbi:MAG: site-2 protease family protein, partial [Actinobacteria bacterium]|nr:site-2 protease family protein [Actinomycetota bacterium]